jgi:hypothetical protein
VLAVVVIERVAVNGGADDDGTTVTVTPVGDVAASVMVLENAPTGATLIEYVVDSPW